MVRRIGFDINKNHQEYLNLQFGVKITIAIVKS